MKKLIPYKVNIHKYRAVVPGNDHASSVWMPRRADLPDYLLAAHDTPSASLPDWSCVRNATGYDSAEGIGDPAQQ